MTDIGKGDWVIAVKDMSQHGLSFMQGCSYFVEGVCDSSACQDCGSRKALEITDKYHPRYVPCACKFRPLLKPPKSATTSHTKLKEPA